MGQSPEYHYIAYVDEAGDPGLKKVQPIDSDGASEWLILSAVVMRAKWEPDIADWLHETKRSIGVDIRGALHFRRLSPSRRLATARYVAARPLRAISICSNKKNMRRWQNTRAEKVPSQEWFYNWCLRLLLERVTAFCETRREIDFPGQAVKIKVEFSRRGGHRYSQTRAYTIYLRHQEKGGQLYLKKRQILTDLLSTDLMEDHPHWSRPGLQLADVVASAFYSAANTIEPGAWDIEPAKALSAIMAKENNSAVDFGVALQPTPAWKANLSPDQRSIFEYYGYGFGRW